MKFVKKEKIKINKNENLPNLLDSLSQLTYPIDKLEFIIVNDRSSDNSLQILNSAKENLFNFAI